MPSLAQVLDRADAEASAVMGLLGESGVGVAAKVLDVTCSIRQAQHPLGQVGLQGNRLSEQRREILQI